jgi:hypothetical protein
MSNEQTRPRRLLSQIDKELVAEGVRGIQSGRWVNSHQAAKVLAERAKGCGTRLSTIGRLHRKIRENLRSQFFPNGEGRKRSI